MTLLFRFLIIFAGAGGAWLLTQRLRRQDVDITDPEVSYPAEHFSAWRINDTETHLRWEHEAGGAVIYAGTSPEEINREDAVASVVNVQEAIVSVREPQSRYFYEIVFSDDRVMTTAGRVIPMEGVQNLRDVGGYMTADGQRVRWHRLYRAASLGQASEADLKKLAAMQVKIICDLRSEDEKIAQPDRVPKGAKYLHLPVQDNSPRLQRAAELMFGVRNISDYMQLMYTRIMLDEHTAVLKTIFEQLADENNLPLLVHCSAGKDRTGITTALVLRFLGVLDEVIIADYAVSNLYIEYFRELTQPYIQQMAQYGIHEADLQPAIIADVNNIQATLDYIDRVYGSAEAYIRLTLGFDTLTLRRIRQNLLEDISADDDSSEDDNGTIRHIPVDVELE